MSNQLKSFDKVLSDISKIKKQGDFIPDVSNKEGYEKSKRFVLDVTAACRKAVEEKHKNLKRPIIDTGKLIDGKKNELLSMIEKIESPHKEAYRKHDKDKKEKKEKFESDLDKKVQTIKEFKLKALGKTSEEIEELIGECGEIDSSHEFYHRAKDAELARQESLDYLSEALIQANNYEQAQETIEAVQQNNVVLEERPKKSSLNDVIEDWADRHQIPAPAVDELLEILETQN